ncbi:DUF6058 family natural product biosynthesis protein [Empedobacter sedimenti]|uniref:DUF6058 family natural product biosynthesis protein n=1 Tax=Empedobacter sedimenti TaxID=3042610 RepID=UPI0024A6248D|nr:DUF6058 family natural product biosynthesis protein [Empedobacter sedimenti]
MKNSNTKYIHDNFIEKEIILSHFGIDEKNFDELIEAKIIPGPSYTFEISRKITSTLNDSITENYTEEYFSKNTVVLIDKYLKSNFSFEYGKSNFREKFKKILTNHENKEFAYNNIFKTTGIDEAKFDENFEDEWDFYINGGYGICTLNATEQEIVEKEIVVKKIMKLYNDSLNRDLNDEEIKELISLDIQFNKVAALFAPYQRINSSRGKYLDQLLKKNNLEERIKNYE